MNQQIMYLRLHYPDKTYKDLPKEIHSQEELSEYLVYLKQNNIVDKSIKVELIFDSIDNGAIGKKRD